MLGETHRQIRDRTEAAVRALMAEGVPVTGPAVAGKLGISPDGAWHRLQRLCRDGVFTRSELEAAGAQQRIRGGHDRPAIGTTAAVQRVYARSRLDSTMPTLKGGKRCTKCTRVKPLKEFSFIQRRERHHSWCKLCVRIGVGVYRETPKYKAWVHEYNRSESTRARKREDAARRVPEILAAQLAHRRTRRGHHMSCLVSARQRLKHCKTDANRARIRATIDRHTAALARLDEERED